MHKPLFVFAVVVASSCGVNDAHTAQQPGDDSLASELRRRVTVHEVDLVSDQSAARHDSNLVNPWGIAFSPSGTTWVANNHSGTATAYGTDGRLAFTATFPRAAGSTEAAPPTGEVYNPSCGDFQGDQFIFAGEDGLLYGWAPATGVQVRADLSASGAIFKGLAIASDDHGTARLYAADFHNNAVTVFDSSYRIVTMRGGFRDSNIPPGYGVFNVQALEGDLYVSYAKQDADAHDDDHGPGRGMVNVFDLVGHLERHLIVGDHLNSPWGLAIAPRSFGALAGKLLVGNFGDGRINVYDQTSYAEAATSLGTLNTSSGQPVVLEGLWALAVGPDAKLYFTAATVTEEHGLFGRLER